MRRLVAAASCLLVVATAWPSLQATPGRALAVQMAATSTLPASLQTALRREASRIWRHHGVGLDWIESGTSLSPDATRLRVIVVERALGVVDGSWPVGQLLRLDEGAMAPGARGALAVLSVGSAREVLDAAGLRDEPEARTAVRLGLVLGRTLAHEIGHFLLDTATHAPRGLMRARIDVAEFADLRDGGFLLDRAAARWMQGRASHEPAAFSYDTP